MNFLKKHARFPHPKFVELIKQMYESTPLTLLALTELNALVAANGLKTGMQYKVTDKNWNLIATSVKTTKPLFGIIMILNGESLPSYLETDVFYVDSGPISTNISSSGIEIAGKVGYFVENLFFTNNGSASAGSIGLQDSDRNNIISTNSTCYQGTSLLLTAYRDLGVVYVNTNCLNYTFKFSTQQNYSGRAVLKFSKSYYN
jgi:hypothetical protein